MAIEKFQDIVEAVQKMEKKTVIAVVQAQDEHTLDAIVKAKHDGLIQPVLIGDEAKIREIITAEGADPAEFDIRAAEDEAAALKIATDLVKAGEAKAMMKGKLQTGDFMRAVVKDDRAIDFLNA